mmetsp:Transcript_40808/g.97021  ORF Transcript_40808/g.97021 Transcript_40808/m.97021 type:complete len:941 (+) Transcript_40808:1922-4744(+)
MLDRDLANGGAVKVVQSVDVVLDAALFALDGRDDEQVLQVGIGGEGGVLQHDLLQELDELALQVVAHEGLHAHRDLLRVLALGECRAHDLVDQLTAVGVVLRQNRLPEIHVLTLNDIARLQLEQGVVVGARHERLVALPALVRHTCHVRVALLTVLADRQRVVVRVGRQEVLRVVVGVDDYLTERVVDVHVRRALADEVLQEGAQELEAMPLLDLLDQGLNREQAADAEDEVVDEVLRGLAVEERTHDVGRLRRVDLLHVALDVAEHVVGVQVVRQVPDHVEAVADVDERPRVRELRLHQELLRASRVVEVGLPSHSLHLFKLPSLGRCLDVLEMSLRILAEGNQRAKVEVQAFIAPVRLEELDDPLPGQLLRVFLSNLHHKLQVLPHVCRQELPQAVERPVRAEVAKVLHQRLWLNGMRVDDDALDVREVSVVLEGAHVQPRLLAQLRNPGPVVVRERVVGKDRVRHVRVGDEVDLQNLGLKQRMLRLVVRKDVEEERCCLPHHVALKEEIAHGVDFNGRVRLLGDLLRQPDSTLRVAHHHRLQEVHVIRCVALSPSVLNESLDVALLGESSHHLLCGVAGLVTLQGPLVVPGLFEQVAELLAGLKLVVVHPVVDEVLLVLREDELRELHALVAVQFPAGQQRPKVLEKGARLPRLRRNLLEPVDGARSPERTLRGLCSTLRCFFVLPRSKQPLKLLPDQVLGARQVPAPGKGEREVQVVQLLADKGDHGLLVHSGLKDLASPVDCEEAADGRVVSGNEDGVRGDAVPVHSRGRLQVVNKQQSKLCDHVHKPVLAAYLHRHREVVRKICREKQLCLLLQRLPACGSPELDDVHLGDHLSLLHHLLGKRDDRAAGCFEGGEAGSVRIQCLRPALLHGVQLHEALHELRPLRRARCDANEHGPFPGRVHAVVDDLGPVQVGRAVKHFGWVAFTRHVPVIYA